MAAGCRADGPDLPRTMDARLSPQVAFRSCTPSAPPVAELQRPHCGPPPSHSERERLLPLAAAPILSTRALAAAAGLSTEARDLTRMLQSIEAGAAGRSSAEQLFARGALEHALAQAGGDAESLIHAFEHNEAGLAQDPASLVGLFNRGIIASDLGLCRLAARTWRQYLERGEQDAEPGWKEEAGRRLALLPCAGDRGAGTAPDERFQNATETLLPQWVEAREKGSFAAAETLRARIVREGDELARTGDPTVRELAQELATSAGDPGFSAAVAAYVHGRERFEKENYDAETRADFESVARSLRGHPSWLIPWSDIWLAGLDLNAGSFDAVEQRLEPLVQAPETARSPRLQGRVFWTLGLAALRSGKLQNAHDLTLQAEDEFTRGSYATAAAAMRALRAETLAMLGFAHEAWEPRILALRGLQEARGRFSFFHNALLEGAGAAQRSGFYHVTDAFLAEAVAVARSQGNATSETEALLTKAKALRQRGLHDAASRDFQRALAAIRSIEPGEVRDRFEQTAVVGLWADPAAAGRGAEAELLAAADFFAAKGPRSQQLLALRVKAEKERRDGDLNAAQSTLDAAVGVVQKLQSDIAADEAGVRQLDSVQNLFDDAIDTALAEGQPLRALDLLEAARRGEKAAGKLPSLRLAARDAPATQGAAPTILVFGLTDKSFIWWRIDGRAVRWGRRDAAPVAKAVQAVVAAAPAGRATPAELTAAYAALLADALQDLPPGRPLVLVPDGVLQRVPFAALRNPATGVRLIEDRAISLRSSLRAARAIETVSGGRRLPRSRWRVIAVGDPAFDRHRLPLSRLPGSAEEAADVAGAYGNRARLLTESAATAEAVSQAIAGAEILHLAAHATVGADPFRDAVVLAADPVRETSGLATAADLLPADSPLQLVVLSGCSTLGLQPSRSGGLLGLARAFVSRGVPATVGTLWPVDDRRLPGLMTDFHRFLLRGDSAAEALRQAQLAYLQKSPGACCDWAALQLIGDLPAEPATSPVSH
jgi:hypothetical protein